MGNDDHRRIRKDLDALDEWAESVLFHTLRIEASFSSPSRWSLEEFAQALSAHPRHRWLLRRWLDVLTARGALLFDPDARTWGVGTPLPPSDQLERSVHPGPICGDSLWDFYRDCADRLPELMRDELTVQPLLFQREDVLDGIYRTNAVSRGTNAAAAAAIQQIAPTRVIEVGAGTGATTRSILNALPDGAEYLFTDVTPYFFDSAAQLSDRVEVRTRLMDINRSEQLPPYQAVVAGNVLHNAWDIDDAAAACVDLVEDGGHIVMIETGREHRPLLLSMAFLMSQSVEQPESRIRDQRRHDARMLLRADEWERAFERAGAQVLARAPGDDHSLSPSAQFVLVARRGHRKDDIT
ncbi:MAG: class I SAM-dependent methyltransferase [Brevibacterium yomogidense]|uniref:class I SAM-dependent methyltransferase n=1 Tax=Brevibacterium sp. Mu109 TaxID=1255669 RepID=UPI0015E0BFE8|nr:class I SAM-dependent methyltransferase [Brevibacterium sp. Mu109]